MGAAPWVLPVFFVLLGACRVSAWNSADPASSEFLLNQSLQCVLSGCDAGSGASLAAPSIAGSVPTEAATAVGVGTVVRVTFTRSMASGTITVNTVDTDCAVGSLKLSATAFATCVRMAAQPVTTDNLTFEVRPFLQLSGGAAFRIRITTTAESASGSPLAGQYESPTGFTTNLGPTVFLTATAVPGNMGAFGPGPAGADSVCNQDANRPWAYSAYKAILVDDALARRPVPPTDWPLLAGTQYYKPDGSTPLDLSDANGIFAPPLTNALTGTVADVWTGMNNMWALNVGLSCQSWTSNLLADNGRVGAANSATATFVNAASRTCDQPATLYCAEQ